MSAAQQALLAASAGGGGDPYFSSVVLLLHMDGTNGSTTFTDKSSSAKTVTVVNNTAIANTATLFGGNSAYFDGNGDILTLADHADWDFGTGAGTIELFTRAEGSFSGGQHVIMGTAVGTGFSTYTMRREAADTMLVQVADTAPSTFVVAGSVAFASDTWIHWALTKTADSGGNSDYTVWKDGALINTTPLLSQLYNPAAVFCIGNYSADYNSGAGPAVAWKGWMRELRITKGVCRYTSAFTTPSAPFPES